MYIHFTTQNFKHDTENYGYVGNPGLVDSITGESEVSCGCYVDIEGCYLTNGTTYVDEYSGSFSYHGFVPLRKIEDDLQSEIIEFNGLAWALFIKGVFDEDSHGNPIGKLIRVAILKRT